MFHLEHKYRSSVDELYSLKVPTQVISQLSFVTVFNVNIYLC